MLCEGVATVVEPAFADLGVHAVADFSPAVRDGKMLAAKPKDYPKEEDRMRSDQIP